MKMLALITVLVLLSGCSQWDEPLMTRYDNSIRELGKRVNWNKNNGKTKDFILTVRYKEDGIVFCPSFIVHPKSNYLSMIHS